MTVSNTARHDELGGNTSTGLLKLIALACMLCDHLGVAIFKHPHPAYYDLRVIGRIAFPLYCWCMVVGACRTRSMPKYLLRLGLVFLVSQPLYMLALDHTWNVPNIFLTLIVGLCGIWGLRARKWGSQLWAPVLAIIAAVVLKCDAASYGWKGVLLMMLLYAARGQRKTLAAVMIAFCLFWGNGSVRNEIFGISLAPLTARTNPFSGIFTTLLQLQSLALLSLPLMIWPDEVRIPIPTALQAKAQRTHLCIPTRMPSFRMPAWLGYAIYPAHLLLLIALKYQLNKPLRWEYLTQAWEQFIALF